MSEQVIVESPAVQAPVKVPVTTRDVLHRAADLLEEFGWCQGEMARDARGRRVLETDASAVSFCMQGALERAEVDLGHDGLRWDEHFGTWELYEWNNAPGRTRAEVVARLREAAEAAT